MWGILGAAGVFDGEHVQLFRFLCRQTLSGCFTLPLTIMGKLTEPLEEGGLPGGHGRAKPSTSNDGFGECRALNPLPSHQTTAHPRTSKFGESGPLRKMLLPKTNGFGAPFVGRIGLREVGCNRSALVGPGTTCFVAFISKKSCKWPWMPPTWSSPHAWMLGEEHASIADTWGV